MSILLRGNDYGIDISLKNCENSKQILSSRIAPAAARRGSDRDATYRDQHKTPDVKILMAVCRDLDENCCDYMAESMQNNEYEEPGKRRNVINEHMCIWCGKYRDRRTLH